LDITHFLRIFNQVKEDHRPYFEYRGKNNSFFMNRNSITQFFFKQYDLLIIRIDKKEVRMPAACVAESTVREEVCIEVGAEHPPITPVVSSFPNHSCFQHLSPTPHPRGMG